ncbi:uncharacterized protein LOC135819711 [Sycon ciliatum]|uniref:uncharacterized protein LOC135819711 n=1 Tax=Sycon ciliatum TaxID=27933 RepID=UPI0031F70495
MSAGGVQLSSRSSINMAVFKRSRWKSVCDRGPFGVFWMLFLVAFSMRIGGSLGNGDGSLATVDSTGQWSEAGGETEMTTDKGLSDVLPADSNGYGEPAVPGKSLVLAQQAPAQIDFRQLPILDVTNVTNTTARVIWSAVQQAVDVSVVLEMVWYPDGKKDSNHTADDSNFGREEFNLISRAGPGSYLLRNLTPGVRFQLEFTYWSQEEELQRLQVPFITNKKPEVVCASTTLIVEAQTTATMFCNVSGYPIPSSLVNAPFARTLYLDQDLRTSMTLKFVNVTREMTGVKCIEASHRDEKMQTCFHLSLKNIECNHLFHLPAIMPYFKKSMKSDSHTKPGARFYYECKKGFVLVGSHVRVCQPNGQWSGAPAQCATPFAVTLSVKYSDGHVLRLVANQKHERIECHAHGLPTPSHLRWEVEFAEHRHNEWRSRGKTNASTGVVECVPDQMCQIRPKKSLLTSDVITCRAGNTVPTREGRNTTTEESVSIHIKIVGRYGIVDDLRSIPIGQTTDVDCQRPEKFEDTKYDAFWVRLDGPTLAQWREDHRKEIVDAYLASVEHMNESFLVENATTAVNGYYACFVEKRRGLSILVQTLELKVQVLEITAKETTPTKHSVHLGNTARLRCEANGATQIDWLVKTANKGLVPIESDPFYHSRLLVRTDSRQAGLVSLSELVIPLMQAGLEGQYVCSATNGYVFDEMEHDLMMFAWGTCKAVGDDRLQARCGKLLGMDTMFAFNTSPLPHHQQILHHILVAFQYIKPSLECQHDKENAERFLCAAAFPGCVVTERATSNESWPLGYCQQDCLALQTGACAAEWRMLAEQFDLDDVCTQYQSLLTELRSNPTSCTSTREQVAVQPSFKDEGCYCDKGQLYSGTKSHAQNKLTCQPWQGNNTLYVDQALEENHCRNPNGLRSRPWCFTRDAQSIVSDCNLRRCSNDIAIYCKDEDWLREQLPVCAGFEVYRGQRVRLSNEVSLGHLNRTLHVISTGATGLSATCSDHLKQLLCLSFARVCNRQAAGHCGVVHPPCKSYYETFKVECAQVLSSLSGTKEMQHLLETFQRQFSKEPDQEANAPECIQLPMPTNNLTLAAEGSVDCLHPDDPVGQSYRGQLSTTISGHACQPWKSSYPHQPAPHLHNGLVPHLDGNACRNPFGSRPRPWCYSTNTKHRWESCSSELAPCDIQPTTQPQRAEGNATGTVLAVCIGASSVFLTIAIIAGYVIHLRRMKLKAQSRTLRLTPETHPMAHSSVPRRPSISETHHPRYFPHSPFNILTPGKHRDNPLYPVISPDLHGVTKLEQAQLKFEAKIAEGNFGTVWRAVASNVDGEESTTVAVKTLKGSCTKQTQSGFIKEAQAISRFKHINIIRLLGVCPPSEDGSSPLCLVFEYMEYGDLLHFLKEAQKQKTPSVDIKGRPLVRTVLDQYRREQESLAPRHASQSSALSTISLLPPDLCKLAAQVAYGMHFLSSRHYVHRDLAARNCLVGRNNIVKIADFGLSREVQNRDYYKPDSSWGTLPVRWMPPEVIRFGKHSTESDVWSFGVVLWEIFTFGGIPYFECDNEEVVKRVCDLGKRLPQPHDCPVSIYQMMLECWSAKANDRPTFRQLWKDLTAWRPPRASLNAAGLEDAEDEQQPHASLASDDDLLAEDEEDREDDEREDEVFEGGDSFLYVTSPHGNIVPVQDAPVGLSISPGSTLPKLLDRRALKSDSGVHVSACDSVEESPMSDDNFTDGSLSESTHVVGRPRSGVSGLKPVNPCCDKVTAISPSSTWDGSMQSARSVKAEATFLEDRSQGDGLEQKQQMCEYEPSTTNPLKHTASAHSTDPLSPAPCVAV